MEKPRVALLMAAAVLSAAWAFAQTNSGISGVVIDASNAVVPLARLTVTHVDTGGERQTQSNEAGFYSLPSLTPGNYRIMVEKEGFKPTVRTNVRLEVNQMARLDFTRDEPIGYI